MKTDIILAVRKPNLILLYLRPVPKMCHPKNKDDPKDGDNPSNSFVPGFFSHSHFFQKDFINSIMNW